MPRTRRDWIIATTVVVLWRLRPVSDDTAKPGEHSEEFPIQIFLIMFGLAVFLIEPLRAASPVIGSGIRLWEVLALVGLALSLSGFAARAAAQLP